MLLGNFSHLLPEKIFSAVEIFGGRCTGRFLVLNAMENRVYDVELEDGSHRVIKFYRPGRWDEPTLQAEHDFLKELEKNEVPVVCPLVDDKGKTLFHQDGIWFAVFPKQPGRLEPELDDEKIERLGRFLARLHNVGTQFRKTTRLTLGTAFILKDLETLITLKVMPDNVATRMESLIQQTCQITEPLFKSFDSILLHGDCHCGNVLWRDNGPFFIDFDDMVYAPPVQDIWMLTGADDEYGRQNRQLLIESYEEMRSFPHESLILIEPLRALRMIHFNAWIGQRKEDGAFQHAFPQFGTERYWQEQIEALSNQLEKIREAALVRK